MGWTRSTLFSGMMLAICWNTIPLTLAFAHCEIPCGIYGDEMRIAMIKEDIATIEKSMNQISELSKQANPNYNQLVRWVQNKEQHADKIRDVVTGYFMTQRLMPTSEEDSKEARAYMKKLRLLHQMMFYAMKCKQTTDLAHVEDLKALVEAFAQAYFGQDAKKP